MMNLQFPFLSQETQRILILQFTDHGTLVLSSLLSLIRCPITELLSFLSWVISFFTSAVELQKWPWKRFPGYYCFQFSCYSEMYYHVAMNAFLACFMSQMYLSVIHRLVKMTVSVMTQLMAISVAASLGSRERIVRQVRKLFRAGKDY